MLALGAGAGAALATSAALSGLSYRFLYGPLSRWLGRALGGEDYTDAVDASPLQRLSAASDDVTRRLAAALETAERAQDQARVQVEAEFGALRARYDRVLIEREEAQQSLALRDGVLSYIREAMSTQLTATIGSLDLVMDGDLAAPLRDLLTVGRTSADACGHLLDGLDDAVSRPIRDLPVHSDVRHLRKTVSGVLRGLAVAAERKGVELVARYGTGLPTRCNVDWMRLRLVLSALVSRAMERSSGGTVGVFISLDDPTRPRVGPERVIRCEVEDSGQIISEEDVARLFSAPLGFGPGSVDDGYRLASELLSALGGEVWLERSTPRSTRVAFTVPVLTQRRMSGTTTYGRGAITNQRVLIIEESAQARAVVEELLTGWHLIPTAVDTISAGLGALDTHGSAISAILVGARGGSGAAVDILRALATAGHGAGQRVIMMTPVSGTVQPLPEDIRELVAAVLVKPIEPNELLDALVGVMAPRRRQARQVAAASGPSLTPHRAGSGPAPLRLLVVEDNPINQLFAVRLLRRLGHHVVTADNGADALDVLDSAAEPFDLIMMDVQMPVMDGLSATRVIRQREADASAPRLPIIAVTAHVGDGDSEECVAAGMDGFLSKPLNEELLFAELSRVSRAVPTAAAAAAADIPAHAGSERDLASPSVEELDTHYPTRRGARTKRGDGGSSEPERTSPVASAPPLTATLREAPVFDEAKIVDFVAGDMDFLSSLVALFVSTAPKQLDGIKAAIDAADPEALNRAAHQFKGSVGNFVAARAKHFAGELEALGHRGSTEGGAPLFAHLRREADAVIVALEDMVARRCG